MTENNRSLNDRPNSGNAKTAGQEDKKPRKGRRRYKPGRKPEKSQMRPEDYPNCPVCGMSVKNLNIAIEEKKSHEPAHFECIMRELATEVQLTPQERLHYLGSGCFGIVQFEEGKGLSSFSIKRKIQYEDANNKADWRKKISRA